MSVAFLVHGSPEDVTAALANEKLWIDLKLKVHVLPIEGQVAPPRSMTRAEFLVKEDMSASSLNKMSKRGLAPEFIRIPGQPLLRLTAEGYAAWREKIHAYERSVDAKLDAARRNETNKRNGMVSRDSPNHISKRGKKK